MNHRKKARAASKELASLPPPNQTQQHNSKLNKTKQNQIESPNKAFQHNKQHPPSSIAYQTKQILTLMLETVRLALRT